MATVTAGVSAVLDVAAVLSPTLRVGIVAHAAESATGLSPSPPHWVALIASVFGIWALVRLGVGALDALFDRFER